MRQDPRFSLQTNRYAQQADNTMMSGSGSFHFKRIRKVAAVCGSSENPGLNVY
jgi:hypothetical protein